MNIRFLLNQFIIKVVDLIAGTWKINVEGEPQNCSIIAFWHGEMLPVWKYFSKTNSAAVVSLSKDGELLSELLYYWQYDLIRGSSSKNGKEVLNKMVNNLSHKNVLITPDGPRGPNRRMKVGAVVSAIRANSKIFLVKVKFGWHIRFRKSWDKFVLPLPFSKINLSFIRPFSFPAADKKELVVEYTLMLEKLMN